MDNDIEREAKQNYLREHILEREYDTNQFLENLMSIKGEDAADVDIWTMDELKEVVMTFIGEHEKAKQAYNSDEEKKPKEIQTDIQILPQNVKQFNLDEN